MDKGCSCRELRTLKVTTTPNEYPDWPGVTQIGQIKTVVKQDGKISQETRYFITSIPRNPDGARQLLICRRGHWSIENQVPYGRDITLGEDASQHRRGVGPQIMAALPGYGDWPLHDHLPDEYR